MSLLALEGCLLLGLLSTFGVVGVLVRHLDAPTVDDARASRAADRPLAAQASALPDVA